MQNIMDKVVNGVTYTTESVKQNGYNCGKCVGHGGGAVCDALNDEFCSHQYVFKVKAIQEYTNVNDIAPTNRPPVPPAPLQKALRPSQGCKYDEGKTLYSLVPPYALEAVAKNLTAGLKKYPARNNWMLVDNAKERYLDALMRHLESHRKGEIYDKENIDPTTTHMSAVAVNALFLLELMLNPSLRDANGTI